MNKEPKVYIILVNYNGWRDTLECLNSILKNDYHNYHVIICDNASQDESIKKIIQWKNLHENFSMELIQSTINGGFSYGNNVGITLGLKRNDVDYFWLLNNDTVIQHDALTVLINYMQHNLKIGIAGSCLKYYDKKNIVQGYGGKYNKFSGRSTHITDLKKINDIDYIIGASLIISKIFIKDIGLMNENYFLYYEELDLALRAKKKGYGISCVNNSIVYHKEGASIGSSNKLKNKSNLSDFYLQRNKILITKKFFPKYLPSVYFFMVLGILRRLLLGEKTKAFNLLKIILGKRDWHGKTIS